MHRIGPSLLALAALASCTASQDDGVVDIAFIDPEPYASAGPEAVPPSQRAIRAATRQGLVRFNQVGEVVPALAERWIVTDDGRSYIFRITEFDLPDGSRLTAQAVAEAFRRKIRQHEGDSLGLDLAKVTEVRAMTGRVIEIRLSSPMPALLQLLAQPELGIDLERGEAGPMSVTREGNVAILLAIPPEQRGMAEQSNWNEITRAVEVIPTQAPDAAQAFSRGQVDAIFGGRMASLPLAVTDALSRGTVRLDSTLGLFGLDVIRTDDFLASATNREALALAIDRTGLVQQFNLGGWADTTRIVPAGLPAYTAEQGERWPGVSLEQRRARASSLVRAWESATSNSVEVIIDLPTGPGSDILFAALQRDFAAVGIDAKRARPGQGADLALRDETARYAGARWFLNQFHCSVSPRVCSPDADYLMQLALDALNPAEEASYLAEAESTLLSTNLYIPLGAPIRWSQVRAGVEGFSENAWAFHPLFPLSRAPI